MEEPRNESGCGSLRIQCVRVLNYLHMCFVYHIRSSDHGEAKSKEGRGRKAEEEKRSFALSNSHFQKKHTHTHTHLVETEEIQFVLPAVQRIGRELHF